jgi:hypothetical protein
MACSPYAERVMAITVQLIETVVSSDDPMKAFVWQSWSRIAGVLKDKFAQCLPVVMKSLLDGVDGIEVLSIEESRRPERVSVLLACCPLRARVDVRGANVCVRVADR